jgi:putative FmdB family regulatory protein
MPFYEYECQACKYYTEVMQKITDAPLTKCPSCGKRRLQKLVSAPVFRLKGEGWYETDFKSDKEAKRNLLAAEKEEAKAETKPDAKEAAAGANKEATGKDPAAASTGKEATPKEAKEPASAASEGPARRARPKPASRGAAARKTAAARLAESRRSTRGASRRKARRGRR